MSSIPEHLLTSQRISYNDLQNMFWKSMPRNAEKTLPPDEFSLRKGSNTLVKEWIDFLKSRDSGSGKFRCVDTSGSWLSFTSVKICIGLYEKWETQFQPVWEFMRNELSVSGAETGFAETKGDNYERMTYANRHLVLAYVQLHMYIKASLVYFSYLLDIPEDEIDELVLRNDFSSDEISAIYSQVRERFANDDVESIKSKDSFTKMYNVAKKTAHLAGQGDKERNYPQQFPSGYIKERLEEFELTKASLDPVGYVFSCLHLFSRDTTTCSVGTGSGSIDDFCEKVKLTERKNQPPLTRVSNGEFNKLLRDWKKTITDDGDILQLDSDEPTAVVLAKSFKEWYTHTVHSARSVESDPERALNIILLLFSQLKDIDVLESMKNYHIPLLGLMYETLIYCMESIPLDTILSEPIESIFDIPEIGNIMTLDKFIEDFQDTFSRICTFKIGLV